MPRTLLANDELRAEIRIVIAKAVAHVYAASTTVGGTDELPPEDATVARAVVRRHVSDAIWSGSE
jgi:hypothetical protein